MKLNEKDKEELINLLRKSVDDLYNNEEILFEEDTSERCKMFHLARYMFEHLKETSFKDYNLDCEYNRYGIGKHTKTYYNSNREKGKEVTTAQPDIVIHKRTKEDNVLIIEIKCEGNTSNVIDDINKLKYFTKPNEEYKYKLGIHLVLSKIKEETTISLFEEGKKYGKKENLFK